VPPLRIAETLAPVTGGRLGNAYCCLPCAEFNGKRFFKISKCSAQWQKIIRGSSRSSSAPWAKDLKVFQLWSSKIRQAAANGSQAAARKKTQTEQPLVTIRMPVTFAQRDVQGAHTMELLSRNDTRIIWLPVEQEALSWFFDWVFAERLEIDGA
jgi:hypothetical protein